MFCPKCGEVMQKRSGTYECVAGNMPLSEYMARELYASFVAKSQPPEAFVSRGKFRFGGTWYCPGCGVAMVEESPGEVRCPLCRRDIAKYLYGLVELHPHN